jgi:hypothetical protein
MASDREANGPIYIGGLERSGKTYMRLMLAAHPDLFFSKRTNLWTHYYGRFGDLAVPANLDRCLAALLSSKHVRALQPDADRLRLELGAGPASDERLFGLLHSHQAERLGKTRWGDQTEGIEIYAGRILAADPGASLIHMIRDPRDRYEALRARGRGGRAAGLRQSTTRWLHSARLAQQQVREYPGRYRVVRYETLVSKPWETLCEVCDFLGLEPSADMLAMGHVQRFAYDGAVCPLSTAYVGRFRGSLPDWAIDHIQETAGMLMADFHYQPEPVRLSWFHRVRGRAAAALA